MSKYCSKRINKSLVYNAIKYANLIEYPDGSKYALIISENKKYYDVIMSTLTQEEKNLIQWIGSDWFPDSPTPSEE